MSDPVCWFYLRCPPLDGSQIGRLPSQRNHLQVRETFRAANQKGPQGWSSQHVGRFGLAEGGG
eukprot:1191621-Prorocentrum_minimum.AAC.4